MSSRHSVVTPISVRKAYGAKTRTVAGSLTLSTEPRTNCGACPSGERLLRCPMIQALSPASCALLHSIGAGGRPVEVYANRGDAVALEGGGQGGEISPDHRVSGA